MEPGIYRVWMLPLGCDVRFHFFHVLLFHQLAPSVLSAVFTYPSVRCNYSTALSPSSFARISNYPLSYSGEFLACLSFSLCLPACLFTSFTHVDMSVACDSSSSFYFPDLLPLIVRFSHTAMPRWCKLTISVVKDFKTMDSFSPKEKFLAFMRSEFASPCSQSWKFG